MATSSSTIAAPSPEASTRPDPSHDGSGRVGPPAGRRESLLTAGALALATVIGLVVLITTGVTASPDVGPVVLSFATAEIPAAAVVVRVVLVVASAVLAGAGLARSLTRLSLPAGVLARVGWACGLITTVAVVVAAVLGDAGWPAVVGHLALAALVVFGLRSNRPSRAARTTTTAAAVLLTGAVAVEVAEVRWGPAVALELLATVLITAAVATVVANTASTDGPDAGLRRRAATVGVSAAGLAALLGLAQLFVDGPYSLYDLAHTARGPVTVAQILLPIVAAALLAPALRRPAGVLTEPGTEPNVPAGAGLDPTAHVEADATGPAESTSAAVEPEELPEVGIETGTDGLAGTERAGTATDPERDADTRRSQTRRRELARWSAVALGLSLAVVAALGALPPSPQAPAAGRVLLRPVQLGDQTKAVLVAPSAGGPTLVRLSDAAGSDQAGGADDDMSGMDGMSGMGGMPDAPDPTTSGGYAVSAGAASVPFTPRPGAPGRWAVVNLPAGASTMTVTGPHGAATVPVSTGPAAADAATLAGPDGPECADALLGDLLGGGSGTACPSAALSALDARQLVATVTDLHARGLPSLYLAGDDSTRSRSALALVRDTAARVGLAISPTPGPQDGLLVLSGWQQATSTLRAATGQAALGPTFTGGEFLAPWLLTPGVVTAGSSTMFPLTFTPQEPTPRGYAGLLAAVSADAAPSSSGYLAWAHARGLPAGPVRMYAASTVDVMPGMPGMASSTPGAWFPGGAVVPLSKPLP